MNMLGVCGHQFPDGGGTLVGHGGQGEAKRRRALHLGASPWTGGSSSLALVRSGETG